MQKSFVEQWKALNPLSNTKTIVLPSVEDALQYARGVSGEAGEEEGKKIQVFITGSVHLVGRALGTLEGVDAL